MAAASPGVVVVAVWRGSAAVVAAASPEVVVAVLEGLAVAAAAGAAAPVTGGLPELRRKPDRGPDGVQGAGGGGGG